MRRSGTRSALLALALYAVVLGVVPSVSATGYLTSGGNSACPLTNPSWTLTGCDGGIVDPETKSGALGSANLLFNYNAQGGKSCGSAATCKALCDSWPLYNGKKQTPLNGDTGKCSYWSWNGNSDCYLYGCGVCKSFNSFTPSVLTQGRRHRSGGGPGAGSCPGSGVKGDPHFTGADQSHFDFTGIPGKTYCIVSDAHLHINAFYGGRFDKGKPLTWIRKLGLLWGHHSLKFFAREGREWQYNGGYMDRMEVDGQEVRLSQAGDSRVFADGKIQIIWLSARERSGDDEVDVYQVVIGGILVLRLILRPEVPSLRTPNDGVIHFNLNFEAMDLSRNAHGVLGQTYRPDHRFRLLGLILEFSQLLQVKKVRGDNAEGFLDGSVGDYVSRDLDQPDCRLSRFARLESLDAETSHAMEFNSGFIDSNVFGVRKILGLNF